MQALAQTVCQCVRLETGCAPLFVLSLPTQECDFDELLIEVLHIIEKNAGARTADSGAAIQYQLLIFCAGRIRPSWPWLLQNFTKLDKRYKKGLQKLYLVHEKSWIRVCMQLLENVVSPKFAKKVRHVRDLACLQELLGATMSKIRVPEQARHYDQMLTNDDKQSGLCRQRRSKSNQEEHPQPSRETVLKTNGKRKLTPPTLPPARSAARVSHQPPKPICPSNTFLPAVPPKRSSDSRATSSGSSSSIFNHSTDSLIIFEDPDDDGHRDQDEASSATTNLLEALKRSHSQLPSESPEKPTTGQRSSSAPTITPSLPPRAPESLRSAHAAQSTTAIKSHGGGGPPPSSLRRAISGPLTPSSSLRQNFLPPIGDSGPPPKLTIGGKSVTVKTGTMGGGGGGSRVGGLKALFEQKALVAQSLA